MVSNLFISSVNYIILRKYPPLCFSRLWFEVLGWGIPKKDWASRLSFWYNMRRSWK